MKTAAVLFVAIVAQAIGNVYLTKGMKAVASIGAAAEGGLLQTAGHFLQVAVEAARNPAVLIGTLLLIIFFALYAAALSWADLSFVLPATAFGYVLNVAAGHYFLNETVSPVRWAGAAIITLGVVFVSRSGERTVEVGEEQLSMAGGGE
ncbi:MAG TPA: EamA family transporter [Blastocatellia bacterium]|nr:EamA family transporter [Blastocatellia bacterium]